MDRVAPTRRPPGRPQGFQRWDRLLFLHWPVDAAILRPLVDARLSLDTFDGRCFVSLVAFEMRRIRPYRLLPSVPGATSFAELNLRTYVHVDGEEPGVTFFSLDAASWLVVRAARRFWHLPYFLASFAHRDDGTRVHWHATRGGGRGVGGDAPSFTADFSIGEPQPPPDPASLEYFLTERYQFYVGRPDALHRARVHHAPYVLQNAHVEHLDTDVLRAAALGEVGARLPDSFSPGVDVDVYPLARVT